MYKNTQHFASFGNAILQHSRDSCSPLQRNPFCHALPWASRLNQNPGMLVKFLICVPFFGKSKKSENLRSLITNSAAETLILYARQIFLKFKLPRCKAIPLRQDSRWQVRVAGWWSLSLSPSIVQVRVAWWWSLSVSIYR